MIIYSSLSRTTSFMRMNSVSTIETPRTPQENYNNLPFRTVSSTSFMSQDNMGPLSNVR